MKLFTVYNNPTDSAQDWDRLRNIDRPGISRTEFQAIRSVDVELIPSAEPGFASASTHPFKCPGATDGTAASTIPGGTVNGTTVTNSSGTALPGGTLVISNTGTKYVYLEVTITKNVTAGGYVVGIASITTAKLKTGSSVPADTTTVLCLQVASYSSGVRTTQDIISSMSVAIRGTNASGDFLTFWGQS